MVEEITPEGILLDIRDLSNISPGEDDHLRLYLHDGSNEINTGTNTTSEAGLYLWNYQDFTWLPASRYSEVLEGSELSDLTEKSEFENHTSDDSAHHIRYDDSEAITAVDGASIDILGGAQVTQDNLDTHEGDTTNPHNVGHEQTGAASQTEHDSLRTDFDSHDGNSQNPHSVTTGQINAIPVSEKGATNGVAELDGSGLVPDAQLPSIAISETSIVADETERLALDAQTGDVAIQQDVATSYILKGTDPSLNSDWAELETPESPVQSVFGRTGDITASSGDYTHSQIANKSPDDHHVRYADSEARTAVDGANVSIQGTADSTQSDVDSLTSNFNNHETDTTNPHGVTNSQVGAPSQTEFDNHTGDTSNPHNVDTSQTGGITSEQADEIHVGPTEPTDPSENMIWIQTET